MRTRILPSFLASVALCALAPGRSAAAPAAASPPAAAAAPGAKAGRAPLPGDRVVVDAAAGRTRIDRNIYGHFAEHLGTCIYGGIWVGEGSPIPNTRGIRNDVVAALRRIRVPVLRWPGGCFADEYHWQDGIGPREKRPTLVNTNWGGVTENNHFGTHEFMDLCAQLGCEPYICGNVGSGTVREMQQWIEYLTFDGTSPMTDLRRANGRAAPWHLVYFGVGNENWGCGGRMTPEHYADQYRRYATFVHDFAPNKIFKIACGPTGDDLRWTEVLMRECARQMAGLALHYYCGSGGKSRSATRFDEADWFAQLRAALKIEELIEKHTAVMDALDPEGKVALIVDEWGAWHEVEPGTNPRFLHQQNSLRDALVAGVTLNAFNRHCQRVRMANIAQTINVLQAMILTDGPRMVLTPTFHVYEMYAVHQDALMLPSEVRCAEYRLGGQSIPGVSASASCDARGRIHVTLCNLHPRRDAPVTCKFEGRGVRRASGRVLTAPEMTAHNTFDAPDRVKPAPFSDLWPCDGGWLVQLPPRSVVVLEVE